MEVEVYPTGPRARIRGLQSHKRSNDRAIPVARVAANLVGVERRELERGDVIAEPGRWRPTSVIEARVVPVRALGHPLRARGAYKLYAGSAERDAKIRFLRDGFARIRLSAPVLLDVHDRFVLREAGRQETVAGGVVLDVDPPLRPGPNAEDRLAAREEASRDELPALLLAERGAVRVADVSVLTGVTPREIEGAVRTGPWWVGEPIDDVVAGAVGRALEDYHRQHPLREGADLATVRSAAGEALERVGGIPDPALIEALLDLYAERGLVVRTASEVRLATHRVALEERSENVARLVKEISAGEPTPPTIGELVASGIPREVIEAAARTGVIVKVSSDLAFTAEFVARARSVLGDGGAAGITVSEFRERLGTSRKFAVPLLEYFDQKGVTYRRGDRRFLRDPTP